MVGDSLSLVLGWSADLNRIIVGVKYCFRYNQRNRQLRAMNENGEPIDLANMNGPRRRRREKKLMTMEEVNERFPLMKYKIWRSKREAEGLPTEGGVTAPPSRAASVRSKEATRASFQAARVSKESARVHAEPSDAIAGADASESRKSTNERPANEKTPEVDGRRASAATGEDEEDEEDDPIRTAVAPEMLGSPGDNCAICIDTLEDDDDVRGLTCGHAFHAGCVDPWLTSRRAKCPLCAADYYIAKPRPEGAEDSSAVNIPAQPQPTWIGTRAGMSVRTMQILTRGPAIFNNNASRGSAPRRFLVGSEQPSQQNENESNGWRSRFRMPRFGRAAPQPATGVHGAPEEIPTPGELEAGRDAVVR